MKGVNLRYMNKKSTPQIPHGAAKTKKDTGVWSNDLIDVEIEEKINTPNQWGQLRARMFKAFSISHKSLPSGCYTVTRDRMDDMPVYSGKYIKIDSIMRFDDGIVDKVLKEVDGFWKKEKAFKQHGFLHTRGYLLYGAQGTGKSSIVWQLAQDVIERGGIVFICENPMFLADGLKVFRQVEPERPIVCVFEDIDAIIKKYGDTELLALLDGDRQIDRVINIATTNYPEVLDKRIVSRPRRFDRIYKILPPNDKVRTAFLTEKLPKGKKVKEWIKKTEGLSFAALTETLISVLCLGNKLDETVKILKDIESDNPSSSDFGKSKKTGFQTPREGDDDDDDDDDVEDILEKLLVN